MHLITPRADWTLVVPLKSSVRGKSRIDVDPGLRGRLAFAMAADTIAAASAAPGVGLVLVVAEDAADGDRLARAARRADPADHDDRPERGDPRRAGRVGAAADGPVAVLPGDLPSLDRGRAGCMRWPPPARTAARWWRTGRGPAPRCSTATSPGRLRPHYGRDSLRRHVLGGAVLLNLPVDSGLRRDVDQVGDLDGVTGPRTLAVLDAAGLGRQRCVTHAPAG